MLFSHTNPEHCTVNHNYYCQLFVIYYPLSARNLTSKIVTICYKVKPKSPCPLMGHLPTSRAEATRVFFRTGVDCCGLFMLKTNCPKKFS